jgi:hypothetical protein
MITKMYLETFASGMKARLDPAYRQAYENNGRQSGAGETKKEIKNSRNVFMPFVNIRKAF